MKQFLNASELSKILMVDRATVSRWIKQGKVPGVFRPPGRQNWRIPLATCEALKRQQLGQPYENH
ncbi:MAG: helix-turn-helix domain-containing protein [Chloroflexi bacterium]|nr:helix-turn-helix domain-containing protein [Chloroflexota bacterium]